MTQVQLRPNAYTQISGSQGWTGTGIVDSLADNDDGTYISVSTAVTRMHMGTVALPAGAVLSLARIRLRFNPLGVSKDYNLALLDEGTGFVYLRFQGYSTANAVVEHASTWKPTPTTSGDGGTPTPPTPQGVLDGLAIEIGPRGGGSLRHMALYADVKYVIKPVVTVTAVSPDPYPSSTVPVSWSNTLDTDGGGQTHYEKRVFTAAQYGIGGFNPATSPAYDETGVVTSASASHTWVGLTPGTTFRSYVRVAQTVNGTHHWSDWAYDQFAVDALNTADIADMTLAVLTSSIEITIDRLGGVEWEQLEVQRSLDLGTTWLPLRGGTHVTMVGADTQYVVEDWESPPHTPISYRARASRTELGFTATGSWLESQPVTWDSRGDTWWKDPDSGDAIALDLAARPVRSRSRASGVHHVRDRLHPIVVSATMQAPSAMSLVVEFDNRTEAEEFEAFLESYPVVLLQVPFDSLTGYYAVTGAIDQPISDIPDVEASRWTLQVHSAPEPPDLTAGQPL